MGGLAALKELRAQDDAPRTIILSGDIQKDQLLIAVQLGAQGLVLKDAPTELLLEAMSAVMAGQCWVGRRCSVPW
jgi:DNA-binding NarL/FixJ family response regulator